MYQFSTMPQQLMPGMATTMENTTTTVEVLEVPNNTVGLIIGKGGEQINSIQSSAGCRVQMSPETNDGTQVRQCTLSGAPEAIGKAKQQIMDIIARAGQRETSSYGNNGVTRTNGFTNARQPNGHFEVSLTIPANRAGLIIGKGGEMIRQLQDRFGVRMNMVQDAPQSGVGNKTLQISGDPEKVEAAKNMVNSIISRNQHASPGMAYGGGPMPLIPGMYQPPLMGGGAPSGGGGGQISMGEVIVPRSSVGMIIGKGGENIKRMAHESGARIQFKADDPSSQERVCTVHGSLEAIQRATNLITQCVTKSADSTMQQGVAGQEIQSIYMHVPASKTGLVIGRGGEAIKHINETSGAQVELMRTDNPNAPDKVFVIRGTPYQVHVAQHMIRVKVGDSPPDSDVPPFPGPNAAYGSAMGGFPTGGYYQPRVTTTQPTMQQWNAQQQQYAPAGDTAWAQYYTTQQAQSVPGQYANAQQYAQNGTMQTTQPHQQQQQQQQQTVPAVNPITGQPDYSAQWIEYYRSMNMHEQAQIIEQQQQRARAAAQQRAALQSNALTQETQQNSMQ